MAVFYPACFGSMQTVFDGFGGDDSNPTIVSFIPRNASVNLNGYREADTFEIEIDAKAFPLSPELVRASAVELYLFQTDNLQKSALYTHREDGKDVWNTTEFATEKNLVITGLVDEVTVHYGDDGSSLRVTGRDYTALLLNREWPPNKRIPIGQDLRQAVQDIVDEGIGAVVIDPKTGESKKDAKGNPIRTGRKTLTTRYIDTSAVETLATGEGITHKSTTQKPPPKTGSKHGRTQKAGFPVRSGKNYWDVIYSLCISHAKIAYVKGLEVIISDPHTLTQESFDRAIKVAYGRNLKNLEISRQLGNEAVPQVIASFYDPIKKVNVTVEWPPNNAAPSLEKGGGKVITGVGTIKETVLRITPPLNIRDEQLLRDYCKAYYDNLARHEAAIKFQTKFLRDLKGDDILLLRPSDPVKLTFDSFAVQSLRQMDSANQRYNRLRELGYNDSISNLIAQNYDKISRFEKPYYTKDVRFSWSISDGIAVDVEAVNYIEPKRDDPK